MFIISTLFLISFIVSVLYLISGKITISKISRFFLKIALIGQTYLILNGKILLESKTFEMNLFVCSWIVGIFSILIMRPFFKSLYTLFISPACFLLSVPLIFISDLNVEVFSNKILIFHVMTNLISHTLILIGSIVSILYIYQHKNIKEKIINKIDKLPSLSTLEKIIFLIICISFPIMTLGFSLGFILSKEQIGTYWFGTVSAISVISWMIFFIVIQIKAFFGFSGLKISYYCIVGLISIIFGYIAMYYLELPSHTFL
tara:strand:- start:12866 stop:13642 length:777 start_codon:yes stop_codon:yes gene_type:complete